MPRSFIVFALLFFAVSPDSASAGRRVALVIGNGAYMNVVELPNPPRDATAIADLLKNAGFDVVAKNDVTQQGFRRALQEFEDQAEDADIAVVFYAGHAIEVGGENYMIPVDARLEKEKVVEDETVSLERIFTAVEPANRLRLVILDACRENPFARKMQPRVSTRQIVSNGLALVTPTISNTLIAYAAKAGSVAKDGDREHSPFTTALLKHLTEPGLDIRLALGWVHDDVLALTRNEQEPFFSGALGGKEMPLVPAQEQAVAPEVPETGAMPDIKSEFERLKKRFEERENVLPADQDALTLKLQQELKRVNCYSGSLDGKWGDPTRDALGEFARQARLSLSTDEPTEFAIDALKASKDRACRSQPIPTLKEDSKSSSKKAKRPHQPTTTRKEDSQPLSKKAKRPSIRQKLVQPSPARGRDCTPYNGPYGYYANPYCSGGFK